MTNDIRHKEGTLALAINFHKKRGVVRANTAWIEGLYLENVPVGLNGYGPGMVLIHREWSNLYFLIERHDWGEVEYFKLADKLFKKKGIAKP